MRVFLERTDEEHPMSVKELIIYLNSLGISAERKTVYDDIETLRNFGMDILNRREQPAGFYLASRKFELPELKLLVDAVQSSRFITSGKSRQLIGKLESLASVHEARQLRRQVFVQNRVRTMNESVYYSIDEIQRALTEDQQISFQYCEWTVEKELRLKKNGERYRVSPWGLVWQNENYYLVACDEKCGRVKHYRVDKIMQIRLTPGESIYIQQYLYHDFEVEPGTGDVLLGEVSQCNDDAKDNRFNPPMGRFPAIEEDEAPYRLLCTEYPAAKD